MVCDLVGGATRAIRRGSEISFVHGRMKTPNAGPQAIELKPRCSEQAHSNWPRIGFENENMEYGRAFRIICAPSIICPLSRANAKINKSFNSFRIAGTNGRLDFSLWHIHPTS